MNYFGDWYSQPNDENEEQENDLMKRWASMLESAAADIPSGGLQNDPQMNSGLASYPSDFINRIVENNTIPQLVNRGIADIDSWFEDQNDLPTRDQSVYDFLRKPEEPLDDLGFFNRTVPAKLFRDIAGGTGPDQDFWERQLVNRNCADINSWFEDRKDLPTRDQSEYDFLRKQEEPLGDLGFFDRNVQENPTSNLTGSSGLDDFFWGGLRNESNLEAQLPRADRLFNSGSILASQAGDTTNQWNSPAEAGKDKVSDKPDAAMQLKNFQERFPVVKIYAPPDFPIPKKLEAFQKWYDSLPVKPTGADVKVKIVPKGEPGSEKGNELGNTGLVVVPEKVELGVKLKDFNLDEYIDPREWYKWIRKGFKR